MTAGPSSAAGPSAAAAAALLARPGVARLLPVLDGGGEETRVVGGAVRDALLGRPVREVDLATTALPAVTTARAEAAGFRAVPTGIAHGTVTVLAGGESIEVTTLREDVETDGRHAVVRFGRDFVRDAERRDFTINALSLGRDGTVHDPVGGLADLAAGRVRFIGAPRGRIREDYLRVLRFFRFSAEYAAGPLDGPGLDAAIRERDGLAVLSRERVRTELLKLLRAARAPEVAAIMSETGLLGRVVGGVAELGRLRRAAGASGPAGARPEEPALPLLAALLVRTGEDAFRLRERLRLSNAETERLASYADVLAALGSVAGPLHAGDFRRTAFRYGVPALRDALAATEGEPRPVLAPDAGALLSRYRTGEERAPVFPLRGSDLLARGEGPGPEIGRRLAALRRAWEEAGCPPDWAG